MNGAAEPLQILLVEDNPGDARLVQEALRESGSRNILHAVEDGETAMAWLRREAGYEDKPRPDIILLDLNLPRLDGRQVLEMLKGEKILRSIPVVVLTTSAAEADILRSYDLHANCYVTKPADLEQYMRVIGIMEDFWCGTVKLPPRP